MQRSLALLVCLLPLAAAAAPEGPRWAASWQEAVREARARNLPIVVHRHGFY